MIILSHDDLKYLEACHGPAVWQMGSWNSDGVFHYTAVSVDAMEKAAESNPSITGALRRLRQSPEQTEQFIELLRVYPRLVEKISAAYRESFSRFSTGPDPL